MANSQQPVITCVATVDGTTFAQNIVDDGGVMFATANYPGTAYPGDTTTLTKEAPPLQRAVRVTAGRSGVLMKAMVAKHTIDMNGQNVMTDSFNSTSPSNSINGRYPAGMTWMLLDNGDVASNDSIVNVINAGNANIYGRVAVGPGGTIAMGPGGAVGSRLWQSANTGIEPGHFTDDMNFTFPKVDLPYTSGLSPQQNVTISTTNYAYGSLTNIVTSTTYPSPAPVSGVTSNVTYVTSSAKPSPVPYGLVTNVLTTAFNSSTYPAAGTYVGTPQKKGSKWYYDKITGTNYTYPSYTFTYANVVGTTNYTVTTETYDYVIQGGAANMPPVNYYRSSLNVSGQGKILVRGNARLVVGGDVSMSGQSKLMLATDGKLDMYVGGPSCSISGGGVFNPTGYAQNFMLWCADSVTSLALSGNGQFTGCVIAPNADVKLNGGGSGPEDFIGAIIASTVRMNGHYKFHYDEALRNYRNTGRYLITQWNEISVADAYK